jgi:hypothetical protein
LIEIVPEQIAPMIETDREGSALLIEIDHALIGPLIGIDHVLIGPMIGRDHVLIGPMIGRDHVMIVPLIGIDRARTVLLTEAGHVMIEIKNRVEVVQNLMDMIDLSRLDLGVAIKRILFGVKMKRKKIRTLF